MEILVILFIIFIIFLILKNLYSFNKKILDIEIKDFKIFTEKEVLKYRNYLICEVLNEYPELSDREKIQLVIAVLKKSYQGNQNRLNYIIYNSELKKKFLEIKQNPDLCKEYEDIISYLLNDY